MHYGMNRSGVDLSLYDIVLTTYGTMSKEWSNTNKNSKMLYQYEWYRVVLDEAHYIKGRTINTAKAAYDIKGQIKWCMTGTPIQNRLMELFSLIHFIQV